MKVLATTLIPLFLFSIQSYASTPGGSYSMEAGESPVEDGRWDPAWSEAFQSVFNGTWGSSNAQTPSNGADREKNNRALESILTAARRTPEFCGDKISTPAGAQLFALAMAKAMCVPESGCNQNAENPGAPNGSALGLFQIGVGDAKNHRCTTASGTIVSTEDEMKDGAVNAACMAQIMINCATGLNGQQPRHEGEIASGSRGQYGFVGCFWEPVRRGARAANTGGASGERAGGSVNRDQTRAKLAEFTKTYCEAAAGGSDSVVQAGIMTEREVATALNSLVPGELQNQPGIYRGSTTAV